MLEGITNCNNIFDRELSLINTRIFDLLHGITEPNKDETLDKAINKIDISDEAIDYFRIACTNDFIVDVNITRSFSPKRYTIQVIYDRNKVLEKSARDGKSNYRNTLLDNTVYEISYKAYVKISRALCDIPNTINRLF